MITDERINEIAFEFDVHNISIKDFARALLAEVSLTDMLRKEFKTISENFLAFIDHFDKYGELRKYKEEFNVCVSITFGHDQVCVFLNSEVAACIKWPDYYGWKRTITQE